MMTVFVIKEVLFGMAMGYLSQLVFTGVEIAGQLIDFQVGFRWRKPMIRRCKSPLPSMAKRTIG